MNSMERHYRLLTIQERIAQLEGELVVIVEDTSTSPLQDRLEGAIWNLQQAARKLELAPVSTKTDLTQLLQLSIVQKREQKRCQEIGDAYPGGKLPGTSIPRFNKANTEYVEACNPVGGGVPSENEAAPAEHRSRFSKSFNPSQNVAGE